MFMFLPLPIATDRRPKRTPYVTYALAGVSIVVAVWWILGTGKDGDVLRDLAFVPAYPTWHGMLTHMFMHNGWMHLMSNMLFLFIFGPNVEDAMGHVVFGCSYLVCGVSAAMLHLAVTAASSPEQLTVSTVGASGAVFGLLGLFVVRFYRTNIRILYVLWVLVYIRGGTFLVPSVVGIGIKFAQELFYGMLDTAGAVSGVAHWAHIGGFVFGMGYALLIGMESEGTTEYSLDDAEQSAKQATWGSALTHAKRALEQDPTNTQAHLIAAQGYAEHLDAGSALKHYLQAIEVLIEQRQYSRVAETYRAIEESVPQAAIPARQHFSIAAALARAGSYSEAARAYQRIARGTQDWTDWETALLRLGQVCLQYTGDLDTAEAAFQAVLKQRPDSEMAAHAREGLRRVGAERRLGGTRS